MDYVILPADAAVQPLPFYLAEEEWLARRYPERELFFMWQVEPTVIIGRHQLLAREVNLALCGDRGIRVVRRRSGGGAVLADMNNVMFSYITPDSANVTTTFSRYTSMIAAALRALGLDASDTSRNDILIGSRKVSGNSYYRSAGHSIVHGTMLYDCDAELMTRVLSPTAAKLAANGVESVRSRVTTIREHLPALSLADFLSHMQKALPLERTITLTADDMAEISEMSRAYSDAWLHGKDPKGELRGSRRIAGVGEISLYVTVKAGRIASAELTGDFLECGDECERIASALRGVEFSPQAVGEALSSLPLPAMMHGLTHDQLMDIIF